MWKSKTRKGVTWTNNLPKCGGSGTPSPPGASGKSFSWSRLHVAPNDLKKKGLPRGESSVRREGGTSETKRDSNMKQTHLIEDLTAVLEMILKNPGRAREILARIIHELKCEDVEA